MEELPLISVIVPVYNVELYLDRCVKSLLAQSYANLEIILVDDGSTDNSAAICDQYGKEYSNVLVIHTQNGGLSSARNTGLKYVRGDYIGFVDSDDWVANDMYEYLYHLIAKYKADASSIWFATTYSEKINLSKQEENISVLHDEKILEFHLKEALMSGSHSMCRCLFRKDILADMIFPVGFVNEDIPFKFEALSKCKIFVDSRLVKYFYFQARESISRGLFKKKDMALFTMTERLYEMAYPYGGNIRKLAEIKKIRSDFSILARIAFYGSECDKAYTKEVIETSTSKLRNNVFKLLKAPIPFSRKVLILAFAINFSVAKWVIDIYKRFI